MACCDNSWKKWLYILAIIALLVGLFSMSWPMIILAILLALAAYLIKSAPAAENMSKNIKTKSKRKR